MGIRLRPNFRAPYHARDLREFWTRWHMSLSTWFRDYVYIPLGGNRVSPARRAFNILVVFGLSGLWHGANWTFVLWGFYHGLLMILGRLTHGLQRSVGGVVRVERRPRLFSSLGVIWTFLLVTAGWVFFRAPSIQAAGFIFRQIVADWRSLMTPERLQTELFRLGWQTVDTAVILLAIGVVEIGDAIGLRFSVRAWLSLRPFPVRWCAYYLLMATILVFGQFGGPPFIYFQF
jgi:alginate O-acetyltransferase complex protein AlgI